MKKHRQMSGVPQQHLEVAWSLHARGVQALERALLGGRDSCRHVAEALLHAGAARESFRWSWRRDSSPEVQKQRKNLQRNIDTLAIEASMAVRTCRR